MFTVPPLHYSYDALEPYISGKIMELHHDRHHRTYVEKLNEALDGQADYQSWSIEDLLIKLHELPDSLQDAVQHNGGGHYNHSLFWTMLSPDGGGRPGGKLKAKLVETYGSYEQFVEQFNHAATGLFGSGWVWLQPDLSIVTTADQDSLLSRGEPEPILGLDVWEHAYYLDYENHRDKYVEAWWNVVNWETVRNRFIS